MTYMVDGRQYIALTVGGGPRLIAFCASERRVTDAQRATRTRET